MKTKMHTRGTAASILGPPASLSEFWYKSFGNTIGAGTSAALGDLGMNATT